MVLTKRSGCLRKELVYLYCLFLYIFRLTASDDGLLSKGRTCPITKVNSAPNCSGLKCVFSIAAFFKSTFIPVEMQSPARAAAFFVRYVLFYFYRLSMPGRP